jgi:hypothetical protein
MTGIGWLLTAQHVILRYVIARGGIQWSDPGEAIKQIAGATSVFVSQVENAVIRPSALGSDELVAVTVPVAILLLGISALTIVRRVQWPPSLLRWTGAVMVGSLALMLTFVVSFLLWMLVGGYGIGFGISANFQFIELGVAGLLAVCCGTCVVRSRPQPTSVIEA